MKNAFLIISLFLGITSLFGQELSDLKGDYLGQPVPRKTPQVFARGIISSDFKEHGAPTFSADGNEVFWWSIKIDANNEMLNIYKTMRRVEDTWTEPEISPFNEGAVFSPDGKRLYFASVESGKNPYFVEKNGDSWSEPTYINLVTRFPEIQYVYFPTITNNGTLYFLGYLKDQWANIGIYRSELIDGVYAKPELLPESINTKENMRNWTPYIAPDESYLIFCSTRGLPKSDQGDLYICFRNLDSNWTEPINMGKSINSERMERFPSVSPDGKYLFYTQFTPGSNEDVYWVSTKVIDKLKKKSKMK
jgi:Tol biopolymer transport system component